MGLATETKGFEGNRPATPEQVKESGTRRATFAYVVNSHLVTHELRLGGPFWFARLQFRGKLLSVEPKHMLCRLRNVSAETQNLLGGTLLRVLA